MEDIDQFETLTLDLRPDVVKFWPKNDQYAVVGTYMLLEDEPSESEEPISQTRVGSLNLVQVGNDGMQIIQTVSTPFGVYDLHFADQDNSIDERSDAFAVGTSTGSIAIYHLAPSIKGDLIFPHPHIHHIRTIQLYPKDILITSLALRSRGHIAMTLSNGQVRATNVCIPGLDVPMATEIMQHDFQAWTCAFVRHHEGDHRHYGLVSGGDDATLRYTAVNVSQWPELECRDAVEADDDVVEPSPTIPWVERKIHQAGVTAVLPLPPSSDTSASTSTSDGFLLITGSYDDHIRLLHCPNIGRRQVLADEHLGGGVFRIKLVERTTRVDPGSGETEKSYLLIVSCMQAGARIVRLCGRDGQWRFVVEAKFERNHGTLLYASDCQHQLDSKGQRTIISTSFEDKKLFLWKAKTR
ncbi:hypothetical protein BU23DRAFT_126117 [Bimuria novae-zelandiae CBS 107.79]|uniref:WD40 repeat-like protein n=1 Tax=Bimuria novae-zelandiae CBS 107.79 TaxID=1447943 RepID=A0A6A5V9J3_9PLEO|nr:hypothetical protein BU23DRAFT_126117 [Bimuria novae-zelandiae CBS 107.79]